MAATPTVIANSSDTTNDPAATASINPAGSPILIACVVSSATTAATSLDTAMASTGTFSIVDSFGPDQATARKLLVYQGLGMTTADNIDLNANLTATAYNWTILSFAGADPYNFVRQSATAGGKGTPAGTDWDTADTVTASLASAPSASSRCVAFAFLNVSTDSLAQGSGLTELDQHTVLTPNTNLHTSWTASASQQTASYTQSSGNNAIGGVVYVEIGSNIGMTMGMNIGF